MEQFAVQVFHWAIAHQTQLLELVGGSAGLSVICQTILHKLNPRLSLLSPAKRKAYAYTLVQALTLATALSAYVLNNNSIGATYPWLAVLAAAIHRYAVSPYYTNKFLPYLQYVQNKKADEVPATTASLRPLSQVEFQTTEPVAFVS